MVVIGVGNEYRRDDGAGLAVVTSLRDRVGPGAELVLTDAVRADPPRLGRVHRFVRDRPLAGATRTASSHGFGLDDAIRLAREGRTPPEGLHVDQVERGEDDDPAERRRREAGQDGTRDQQDDQDGGRRGQ
jgi:hydrogenase maturation protease